MRLLRKENELDKKVILYYGGIFVIFFLGLAIFAFIESQKNKESFINNQERTEGKQLCLDLKYD